MSESEFQLGVRLGMNYEVFTLEKGQAVLQWPANMSKESYEEFKAWLDLIAIKVKRHAAKRHVPDITHMGAAAATETQKGVMP
jgi:hypothetical protein